LGGQILKFPAVFNRHGYKGGYGAEAPPPLALRCLIKIFQRLNVK